MPESTNIRFSITNIIAAVMCTGLLATVSIPSLNQLKQQSETVICANHLKGCVDGFNLYASVNQGMLMAMWDINYWDNVIGYDVAGQSPYTMWYYIKGEIPAGTVWKDFSGWWNPYTHEYGGFSPMSRFDATPESNPTYHCPTVSPLMGIKYRTPFNLNMLSYTMPFTYVYSEINETYRADIDAYLQLDKFTHASTTVSMHELSRDNDYSTQYNAWSGRHVYGRAMPHMGKGNFSFYDGHVELLTEAEFGDTLSYSYYPYMPREDVAAAQASQVDN